MSMWSLTGVVVICLTVSVNSQVLDMCSQIDSCFEVVELPCTEALDREICLQVKATGCIGTITGSQDVEVCLPGGAPDSLSATDRICATIPKDSTDPVRFNIADGAASIASIVTFAGTDGPTTLDTLFLDGPAGQVVCPNDMKAAVTCLPDRISSDECQTLTQASLITVIEVTPLPCSVDGVWTDWAHTDCSETCGEGTGVRTRTCTNPAPVACGATCVGPEEEAAAIACNLGPCPVDGVWSDWVVSGTCSVTCGSGFFIETRTCTPPTNGGLDCTGDSSQVSTTACTEQDCPVDGTWSAWAQTGDCSQSCSTETEAGTALFMRTCEGQVGAGLGCSGLDSVENPCDPVPPRCAINGGFSEWMAVGSCSVTCGSGTQTRTRSCTNPIPQFDGTDCIGSNIDTDYTCNANVACPVDGGYTEWTQGACSASCGAGMAERTRACTMPVPMNGGAACQGEASEMTVCFEGTCDVNGMWGSWQEGTCSVTCGQGTKTDTRMCNNPAPVGSGFACVGSSTRTEGCNLGTCNVDGGWTLWAIGVCSVSCGTGTQTRTRTCSSPAKAGAGADCQGSAMETSSCTQACDGSWSIFGGYDVCSRPCGGGTQTRTRTCTDPAPIAGGNFCPGSDTESQSCNTQVCAGSGSSPGTGRGGCRSTQGRCSVTCGSGVSEVKTLCLGSGALFETTYVDCSLPACSVTAPVITTTPIIDTSQNGGYGPWSNWGSCSASCKTPGIPATQRAIRVCNNPPPSDGGLNCINGGLGEAERSRECIISICPVVVVTTDDPIPTSTTPLICAYNERVCRRGTKCCRRRKNKRRRFNSKRKNEIKEIN